MKLKKKTEIARLQEYHNRPSRSTIVRFSEPYFPVYSDSFVSFVTPAELHENFHIIQTISHVHAKEGYIHHLNHELLCRPVFLNYCNLDTVEAA